MPVSYTHLDVYKRQLEDGKVGYGGAYLAGKGVVGYAVFVQIPGNLIVFALEYCQKQISFLIFFTIIQ